MNSIKGGSIYFASLGIPNKVRCKICKRLLASGRSFNLKKHLLRVHNIEVRLKGRGRKQKKSEQEFFKPEITDNVAPSSDPKVVNEPLEANENIFNDVPPLVPLKNENARASANESIFQKTLDEIFNDVDPLATRSEIHSDSDSPDLHSFVLNNNNASLESNNRDNGRMLKDDAIQKSETKKRKYNKTKNADTTLTEEPQNSSKEDSFDEALRKRKHLTDLEYLQMRNYKMKLELWAIEQKLRVKSSKFTKEIVGPKSKRS